MRFPQVGGAYSYDCSFGYIPNVELMKFISMATFGSYLSMCPESDSTGNKMNAYHRAFLTYSFLRTGESMNPEYYCGKLNTDTPVSEDQICMLAVAGALVIFSVCRKSVLLRFTQFVLAEEPQV